MKTGVQITKDQVDKVLRQIQRMTDKELLVGIPADEASRNDGSVTNPMLGFLHEHGSPLQNIPARPFLVPGAERSTPKAAKALKPYATKSLTGEADIEQGLEAAGLVMQAGVKNYMRSSEGMAPLAPATIAARQAKGYKGTKPLIRTAQLLNSINYVIRKRDG